MFGAHLFARTFLQYIDFFQIFNNALFEIQKIVVTAGLCFDIVPRGSRIQDYFPHCMSTHYSLLPVVEFVVETLSKST